MSDHYPPPDVAGTAKFDAFMEGDDSMEPDPYDHLPGTRAYAVWYAQRALRYVARIDEVMAAVQRQGKE